MKKIIIFIVSLFVFFICNSMTVKEKADSAYLQDNYTEAEKLYNQIIATEGSSADIYYNLGNTYYRLGKLGRAILNYERALRLDPAHEDARINLDFLKTKIVDKPINEDSIIKIFVDNITDKLHPNVWGYVAMFVFILMLVTITIYLFTNTVLFRKIGFFSAIILFILFIITLSITIYGTNKVTTQNEAIIITGSTVLSTSPREPKTRNEEAFRLNEGSKVKIIDVYKNTILEDSTIWYEVKINNNRAWINASDVEII